MRYRLDAWALAALCLAAGCTHAGTQSVVPVTPVELYLQVSIDGEDTGVVAPFVQDGPHLRSPVATLRDLGLDPTLFDVASRDSFDLDAVPGLHYTYDAQHQRLDLQLGDRLRHPLQLQGRSVRPAERAAGSRGLVLNYDMHAQAGSARALNSLTEVRWFDGNGVLTNTGAAVLMGGERGYVRYDTTWTRSDPDRLSTLEVGDFITPSLSWSRSLRLVGLQWRRNFSLRPDLLTYPVASYGGSAVVPSSVSLYVNGIRQFQSNVTNGPFQIRDIAGVNGAGQASIVTEDALGRIVSATVPLYIDTRLLDAGLTDYAVSFGVPRHGFGLESFDYARSPVLAGSFRRGLNDALTLEAHGEARAGLLNAGTGTLLRMGQAGVASVAIAGSTGRGRGGQGTLGYQYVAPRFSLDMAATRASIRYADSGTLEGTPIVRASDHVTLGMALARGTSVSASYVGYKVSGQPAARVASLNLSTYLGFGVHANLSAFRDLRKAEARGLLATLSVALGDHIGANATSGTQNGMRTRSVSAASAPDAAGGVGWNLQQGSFGAQTYAQGQLEYLGRAGEVRASVLDVSAGRNTSIDVNGALVAMDGAVLATRRIGRGFALVTTGVPDLPVLQEHRLIGRTDGSGRLLVPDLMPYTRNDISIDVAELPADMRVASTTQSVVPQQFAGVAAHFALERYAAATVIVLGADGRPLPPGTPVQLLGGMRSVIGYDGVVFVDGLKADNQLLVGQEVLGDNAAEKNSNVSRCLLHFAYVPAAGGALPSIGPLTCQPTEKKSP